MPFLPLPFASSVVFSLLNLILQSISFSYNISSSSLTWSKFTKKEPSCVLVCSSSKDSQTSSAFYIKVSTLSLRLSFLFFFSSLYKGIFVCNIFLNSTEAIQILIDQSTRLLNKGNVNALNSTAMHCLPQ